MTAIADQLPDAIDDDDDWLGKMLTEDATKTVKPASAEAWASSNSPESQLRKELVAELKPTTVAQNPGTHSVEPLVNGPSPREESTEPDVDAMASQPIEPTSTEPQPVDAPPPPVMADPLPPSPPIDQGLPENALSNDEIASLMSPVEEETQATKPPLAANSPIEPANLSSEARAVCPAGQPKPKIDLKAMQKSKGAASDQVARLFGDKSAETGPAKDPVPDRPTLTFDEPVVVQKKLPRVLQLLDEATNRARETHALLPTVAGLVGLALAAHGTLIAILATLGWI